MDSKLHYYRIADDVEAFSTTCGAELPYYVVQSHQVHSDGIAIVTDPNTKRIELEGVDALITNVRGCAIAVRTADCVPILIYDSRKHVVAAVHSGWRGTVLKICLKVMNKLRLHFGCDPSDCLAVIGPSISVEFFQVGEEVIDEFANEGFPMHQICLNFGERIEGDIKSGLHIDLWKANELLLVESGIKSENIFVSKICTYSNDMFPSARRERNNKCERIINSIKLL